MDVPKFTQVHHSRLWNGLLMDVPKFTIPNKNKIATYVSEIIPILNIVSKIRLDIIM